MDTRAPGEGLVRNAYDEQQCYWENEKKQHKL